MNPASTVSVTASATATAPTTDTIVVTPETLQALKVYVVNNFSNLNLPADIQEIVRQFFAVNPSVD
jgi:hypothetical protein